MLLFSKIKYAVQKLYGGIQRRISGSFHRTKCPPAGTPTTPANKKTTHFHKLSAHTIPF